MESIFAEIRSDYTDDNGVTHIDGWRTPDDEEGGETIAFVIKGEVYYRDPELQFDPLVKEVVAEVKEEHQKLKDELKSQICQKIQDVFYNGDAKPRPEFVGEKATNLSDKLSLIQNGADEIIKLL